VVEVVEVDLIILQHLYQVQPHQVVDQVDQVLLVPMDQIIPAVAAVVEVELVLLLMEEQVDQV
tara:strand:+ start:642 stop:830 length:189 start_codon:yes stop_codon:yes gene_type:complete